MALLDLAVRLQTDEPASRYLPGRRRSPIERISKRCGRIYLPIAGGKPIINSYTSETERVHRPVASSIFSFVS